MRKTMSTTEYMIKLICSWLWDRPARRPKLLCLGCVRKHHGGGGVRNWRRRAKYRENWGGILKKPKPSQGFWAAADNNYEVKIPTVTTVWEHWVRRMSITIQFRNILLSSVNEFYYSLQKHSLEFGEWVLLFSSETFSSPILTKHLSL
jgi:hypothetical protein